MKGRKAATSAQTRREGHSPTAIYRSNFTARYGNRHKLVDNDELRDALKENGIGRRNLHAQPLLKPCSNAIISKECKILIATPTGIELGGTNHEELLKSAELTGIWEKETT